jgi:hypothetical protein
MFVRQSLLILALMLLIAAPFGAANACQLVCMATSTKYDGNLGGIAGADAKCAAEYPGFKAARSWTILANVPNANTFAYNTNGTWAFGADSVNNCSGWTSNSGWAGSAIVNQNAWNTVGKTNSGGTDCSSKNYILCCNM